VHAEHCGPDPVAFALEWTLNRSEELLIKPLPAARAPHVCFATI
jgi:hypothetical protein